MALDEAASAVTVASISFAASTSLTPPRARSRRDELGRMRQTRAFSTSAYSKPSQIAEIDAEITFESAPTVDHVRGGVCDVSENRISTRVVA